MTYSITNSKVKEIGNTGYEDYYQNGDRIWGIPKSNGGATITYAFPSVFKSNSGHGGSVSLGVTYIGNWVSQDALAQNTDYYVNYNYSHSQRGYVINYAGFTLWRLGFNYNITKNVATFLNIDNLFNSNKFEFSNTNPTRGRSTVLGIRFNY